MEMTQTIICRFMKELNIFNANTMSFLLTLSENKVYKFFDKLYMWENTPIPVGCNTKETYSYSFWYKTQVNLVHSLICSKVSLDMNRLKAYYNVLLIGYDGRDERCLKETVDFRNKHKKYFEDIFLEKPQVSRMNIGDY